MSSVSFPPLSDQQIRALSCLGAWVEACTVFLQDLVCLRKALGQGERDPLLPGALCWEGYLDVQVGPERVTLWGCCTSESEVFCGSERPGGLDVLHPFAGRLGPYLALHLSPSSSFGTNGVRALLLFLVPGVLVHCDFGWSAVGGSTVGRYPLSPILRSHFVQRQCRTAPPRGRSLVSWVGWGEENGAMFGRK